MSRRLTRGQYHLRRLDHWPKTGGSRPVRSGKRPGRWAVITSRLLSLSSHSLRQMIRSRKSAGYRRSVKLMSAKHRFVRLTAIPGGFWVQLIAVHQRQRFWVESSTVLPRTEMRDWIRECASRHWWALPAKVTHGPNSHPSRRGDRNGSTPVSILSARS
jgi:hypothetical protein